MPDFTAAEVFGVALMLSFAALIALATYAADKREEVRSLRRQLDTAHRERDSFIADWRTHLARKEAAR